MDQYRVAELREVFIELFCTVRKAVDNPMMNPSGSGARRRAILVLDEGELEGAIGLKMKKMEQKDSWMPWKMSFGSGMTMTTLGFREDSKEEEPEKGKGKGKEKEKDGKVEDFSDLVTKEKKRKKSPCRR